MFIDPDLGLPQISHSDIPLKRSTDSRDFLSVLHYLGPEVRLIHHNICYS